MEKIFFFILAYLPFQIALNIFHGFDLASGRIFIILLFLFSLIALFREKRVYFRMTFLDFALLAFFFLMIFSLIFSSNSYWSFRKLLFLFSFLPIYFLSKIFIKNKEKAYEAFKWLIYSSFLVAFLGLIQFFSQFIFGIDSVYNFFSRNILPVFSGNSFSEAILANPAWLVNISGETFLRATSLFPDPHMFSFYLNLSIGINLILLFGDRKKIFWLFSFVVLVLANFLTFSRGGYLAFFVTFFISLIIYLFIVKKRNIKKIIFIFLFIFFLLMLFQCGFVSDRFLSIFDLNEGSNLGRIETWKDSLVVLSQNLFFGVGIGNYPLFIKPNASYREPIYAHSNYLDIALDGGLLALFFWLSLLIFSINKAFFLIKKDIFYLGLFFSLVSFAIHSFFETSLYSVSAFPLFLFIISLVDLNLKNEQK